MRTVMINIDILWFLWPLIFEAIVLITNQIVMSLLKEKTSYEAFMDEFYLGQDNRLSVAYLWVLGYKIYV